MIIIPAIDIYDNKVVRLSKGDFKEVSFYHTNPVKQAQIFEETGFDLIHVVDLEGAKTGKLATLDIIKEIKEKTKLKIEFGGGVRDGKTAAQVFGIGVDFAVMGSVVAKNMDEFKLIVDTHSPEKIVVAADVLNEKVYVTGWTQEASITLNDILSYSMNIGVRKFICTDISKDGTMRGLNVDLYKKLIMNFPGIKLIASGGVKDINEIKQLKNINPFAVVIGKAIYEGKIDLKELSEIAK